MMGELGIGLLALLLVACVALEVLRRRALRDLAAVQLSLTKSEERVDALRRYETIEDVEAEAVKMRAQAQAQASGVVAESGRVLAQAQAQANGLAAEADELRARAQTQADGWVQDSRQKRDALLTSARLESAKILGRAQEEAQQIAGDALDAKGKAAEYKRLARAMKNVIEGYGDEYLIPNRSVLDELAEEFGHKEAGVKLKEARLETKAMLKAGTAATCDYKEATRRDTAVHFVLDAFNGKVDSALAKVRHDNLGKLSQEIKDAFSLVNKNGQAFKDARIEPAYLESRLQELNWAVATNELKIQEREEQRQIKEAMREEERARREFDKAIKEAEKEERTLQKALQEAEKQLKDAGDEQRAQFEQQLRELQGKLEDAEGKNQRAISMAQQTRQGHVYVISNVGSFGESVLKIGLTRRLEPLDRVKELGDASVPFTFDVHAMIHAEDAPALESELHRRFTDHRLNRINHRKEFFSVRLEEVRQVTEELGIDVHWTMSAEAREYRESLALTGKGAEVADRAEAGAN